MPRRKIAAKREILPDPKYGSTLVAKFVNVMMLNGKKAISEKALYHALEEMLAHAEKQTQRASDSLESDDGSAEGGSSSKRKSLAIVDLFDEVLENIRPKVEVRSRRVGGATYQVPVEVRLERRDALAMRWLIQAARGRHEKGMAKRLAAEMLEAHQGRGTAVKKRTDTHRMAEANKAFSHFRWT